MVFNSIDNTPLLDSIIIPLLQRQSDTSMQINSSRLRCNSQSNRTYTNLGRWCQISFDVIFGNCHINLLTLETSNLRNNYYF